MREKKLAVISGMYSASSMESFGGGGSRGTTKPLMDLKGDSCVISFRFPACEHRVDNQGIEGKHRRSRHRAM